MYFLKPFQSAAYATICVSLIACTTAKPAATINTYLTPIHLNTLQLTDNDQGQSSLIDNDGNMYATFWDLGKATEAMFAEAVQQCDAQFSDKSSIKQSREVGEIIEGDLKPTLFKDHTTCIANHGFILKAKKGYYPDKFKLQITRTHSKSSNYMPVGGSYLIAKDDVQYLAVVQQLKVCTSLTKSIKDAGVSESYLDSSIYVTIEPYLKSILNCLSENGYFIEKDDSGIY